MKPLLYEKLISYLIEEIKKGNLKEGDRMPSEKELAERFGVSRITSKRALEKLEQAGLGRRLQGKGTFVASELPGLDDLTLQLFQTSLSGKTKVTARKPYLIASVTS